MARFYMRSKVSMCGRVGYSLMSAQNVMYVLHGEILCEVKVHTKPHLIIMFSDPGRFYISTLTLRKIFPYIQI